MYKPANLSLLTQLSRLSIKLELHRPCLADLRELYVQELFMDVTDGNDLVNHALSLSAMTELTKLSMKGWVEVAKGVIPPQLR